MLMESQEETIAFLKSAAAFGSGPGMIETVETHISLVLLAGGTAVKLKRAVRLPYLDFSTAGLRLAACEKELALNRRTAPALYRAVRRITREPDGKLVLDGAGPLVDAVVEMARFDQKNLFDRLAQRGALTPAMLSRLAGAIAAFHADAEPDHARAENGGGAAAMAAVLDINERAFAETTIFPAEAVAALIRTFRDRLAALADLLDARGRAGRIRRCHGDLHLRNICLVDGQPTLFDCLEFDDAMATIDVLYDLAFLLMDLWHRGLPAEANLVLNRYLDIADEEDGLPLVPFMMGVRAAIRAHVTATQAAGAGGRAAALEAEARSYLELAAALLRPAPAGIVAVGGLSGSGKSTVAAGIAPRLGPAPGARILASDRIRKHLFGVPAETRLPAEAYRPDVSARVYAVLMRRAEAAARNGHAVVADAVFDRPAERERIEQAAHAAGVPFFGLWLDVDTGRLLQRVRARTGDASDATAAVVQEQTRRALGEIRWARLPADGDAAVIRERAWDAIAGGSPLAPADRHPAR